MSVLGVFIVFIVLLIDCVVTNFCSGSVDMNNEVISCLGQLRPQNEVESPFLFCVYHKDAYPAGNEKMEAPRK